jgi:hypothetical protein
MRLVSAHRTDISRVSPITTKESAGNNVVSLNDQTDLRAAFSSLILGKFISCRLLRGVIPQRGRGVIPQRPVDRHPRLRSSRPPRAPCGVLPAPVLSLRMRLSVRGSLKFSLPQLFSWEKHCFL